MTAIEVIAFIAGVAFFVISAIRNVTKQQQYELQQAEKKTKAKEIHRPVPHKVVVKKMVNRDSPLYESYDDNLISNDLRVEQKSLRRQKKVSLPGGSSLRVAMLNKIILDPPLGLK